MPMPPDDPEGFDKINFIIDAWTNPCQAPWYIYLETLKPAALEAFIVLISFGWADVLRGALRPKGLGRRSSKRKGKWVRRVPRFPEVGNTLGKALPFAEQVEDYTNWGTKTKFLWRIDNAMQAGLFMWLVADVAEDFVFNWTSLLYKSYWCQNADLGRFSFHNAGLRGVLGGQWRTKRYAVLDYYDGPPSWGGNLGNSGPNGCTVAATCNFVQRLPWDAPTSCSLRIRETFTQNICAETSSTDPDDDGAFRLPVFAGLAPNTEFVVEYFFNVGGANVGDGVITAEERRPQ